MKPDGASKCSSEKMEKCNTYEQRSSPSLLDLPSEIIRKILVHTNFATVGNARMVCRYLNNVASELLNSEFARLLGLVQERFRVIKAQMPQWQSARLTHPLSCEFRIIEAVNQRLSLLQIILGTHLERKHCCFFPGEILDEVQRILRYVAVTPKMRLSFSIINQLTALAMQYLKEHIHPTLPKVHCPARANLNNENEMSLTGAPPCTSTSTQGLLTSAPQYSQPPKSSLHSLVSAIVDLQNLNARMKNHEVLRRELKLALREVADLQRQMVEMKVRHDAVLKELEYWRSKLSTMPACTCSKTTPLGRGPSQDAFIDFQKAASSSFGVQGVGEVKLVPASFGTPPENIVPSTSDLECMPFEDKTAGTLPTNVTAPVDKSAQPRACKRKLDIDE